MRAIEELTARLDRLEAESALHRLVHDYCVGADHRDRARWAAVWVEDAVWETSPDRVVTGVEAICDAVAQQWKAFPIMQHATVNHVVDIDGDRATGRSDVVVLVQLQDGRWIAGGGTYQDVYRRDDGSWRIVRRRVERPFDLAPLAPSTGPIYVDDRAPD